MIRGGHVENKHVFASHCLANIDFFYLFKDVLLEMLLVTCQINWLFSNVTYNGGSISHGNIIIYVYLIQLQLYIVIGYENITLLQLNKTSNLTQCML